MSIRSRLSRPDLQAVLTALLLELPLSTLNILHCSQSILCHFQTEPKIFRLVLKGLFKGQSYKLFHDITINPQWFSDNFNVSSFSISGYLCHQWRWSVRGTGLAEQSTQECWTQIKLRSCISIRMMLWLLAGSYNSVLSVFQIMIIGYCDILGILHIVSLLYKMHLLIKFSSNKFCKNILAAFCLLPHCWQFYYKYKFLLLTHTFWMRVFQLSNSMTLKADSCLNITFLPAIIISWWYQTWIMITGLQLMSCLCQPDTRGQCSGSKCH